MERPTFFRRRKADQVPAQRNANREQAEVRTRRSIADVLRQTFGEGYLDKAKSPSTQMAASGRTCGSERRRPPARREQAQGRPMSARTAVVDIKAPTSGHSPAVELVLEDAVVEAVKYFRAGKPGRGEYELVRGALRVARMTGDMPSVHKLEDLKYYEITVPVARPRDARLDEIGGAA